MWINSLVCVVMGGCVGTVDGKGTEPLLERQFVRNGINLGTSGKQKSVKKKTEST